MEAYASDWLQLIIRWVHLITGIDWIGASVQAIIAQRCVSCHVGKPTLGGFAIAPKDVKLDTRSASRSMHGRVYEQVVAIKAMPIGNLTGMTDEERAKIAAWVAAEP